MHSGITAASEISEIPLSLEIYERQAMLNERIKLFKQRVQDLQIPMINPPSHTPIGFIVLRNVEAMAQFGDKDA